MRIKGLDFLRGIAILGVLLRHSRMKNALEAAGGYGVDLFFVLSGFLVAGLLFNEYKKTGNARIGRFLVRRGFKIYPAFYFYLIVSILAYIFYFKTPVSSYAVLSEVFFMQSYGTPLRIHTWSLSVEEHFYFILSLLIFIAIKWKKMEKKNAVIIFLISMVVVITTFRFIHCLSRFGKPPEAFFATHLRGDGLFMGALLSYLWYFKRNVIEVCYKHRLLFYVLACVLVAPAFLFDPGSFFMMTFGFNFLHTGFAVFILLLADEEHESVIFRNSFLKKISAVVCFIGIHSYSIYLWHLPVEDILDVNISGLVVHTVAFFVSAIAVGVLFSYTIEKSFLKIRDRYFPKID